MSENVLFQASRRWSVRPDDQRFVSLADLKASVEKRRKESWTAAPVTTELEVLPQEGGDLRVKVYDPTKGEDRLLRPSNWSFNQLAQFGGAPAAYLRKLPAELAAVNLTWGLEHGGRDRGLVLGHSNGDDTLRAITSTSYGRIWDLDVVKSVERVNHDGRWVVPAASYSTTNPKRATTLYASDRDVFIFLVDPKNPVEVGGEQLFRGFMTWNSEVGSAVFGLTTFLYRFVCDNRMVWGATEVKELRIRHTSGAPERFSYEGAKYLRRYAEESTLKIADAVKAAQNRDVTKEVNAGKGETVADWLQKRGFTKPQAKASVETAEAEQGGGRSLWDIVNGITAYARSIPHANERVKVERLAGDLMELVA